MRSKSAALMRLLYFRRAGDIRARFTRETGEEPMSAIRSEKVESSEVEVPDAGLDFRDRGDIRIFDFARFNFFRTNGTHRLFPCFACVASADIPRTTKVKRSEER